MIHHEEPVDGFTEPMFDASRWAEIIRPPEGFDCEETDHRDFNLRCGDTFVAIDSSGIGVGIQVSIDGPIDEADADRMVAVFKERIEQAVGIPVVSVRLPEDKIIRWTH
jgi:hypothetical protein